MRSKTIGLIILSLALVSSSAFAGEYIFNAPYVEEYSSAEINHNPGTLHPLYILFKAMGDVKIIPDVSKDNVSGRSCRVHLVMTAHNRPDPCEIPADKTTVVQPSEKVSNLSSTKVQDGSQVYTSSDEIPYSPPQASNGSPYSNIQILQ